jgi:hypothetical protein
MEPRSVLEHLPFVMAAGNGLGPQLDLKDLIGAVVIGGISAMGSSYITTKELSVEMRVLTKQVEQVQSKMDTFNNQHQSFSERLTRLEASSSMEGNGRTKK